jgi:hypothetical protein
MKPKRESESKAKGAINLKLRSFKNPLARLSEAERLQVIKAVAKQNSDDYGAKLKRIEEIIRSANPLEVLAHYAHYDLLVLDQLGASKDAANERLQQHNVELLQALFLALPIDEISSKPFQPSLIAELTDCLHTLATAFSLRRLADKPADISVLPVEMIRMHTQAIRNLGFPDQIFRFLVEVFKPLDSDMAKVCGIKPSLLVPMVLKLLKRVEDSANDRISKLRPLAAAKSAEEAIRYYYTLMETKEDVHKMLDLCKKRNWSLFQTKAVLLSHYDIELWRVYEFSRKDFAAAYPESISDATIQTLLDLWSFSPGDLVNHDKEHFFLNNPIWKKPIIRIGNDSYFWPLLQMFMSFGLDMIESLVDCYPAMKNRYESVIRPKYLEDEAERIFKNSLPNCTAFRGSLWHDSVTGRDFENDLLVLLDSFLIVVECKSGAIPPSARRGGQRLEVAVRELVKEPAEQSARFAEHLLGIRGPHTFQTKRGVTNRFDTTNIRHVIRLSITIDFFGPLTCMSRLLQKGGILPKAIPPAVTMPTVALETVFEFLEGAHQKLHYLSRRSEWESHVDYMADEYDLLAFYLATGFNVGAFEFENNQHLMIYGLSEKFNQYFRRKTQDKSTLKPSLELTQWWRDILAQSEKRAFDGWTDVGMSLLSARRPDQWNFERAAKGLKRSVRANWNKKGHVNFLVGTTGPAQRQTAISAYAFKDHITRERRDADIRQIFERVSSETGCKDVLVIGIDADEKEYPYKCIALAFGIEKSPKEAEPPPK